MKIAFLTLGCKTNQFETQALEKLFAERGAEILPFPGKADAYIINTCAVTALADKKSRNAIRRARALSKDAVIAVCGCYSQHAKEDEVRSCGADIVIGTADKSRLVEAVLSALNKSEIPEYTPSQSFDFMPAGGLAERTRALLKVQDGCRNFCTYCIIPFCRGECRSLPLEKAASESRRLQELGFREIVLTGIEISSYGVDLPGKPGLSELIKAVCTAAPDTRIRLGSLEPRTVTEEWAKSVCDFANLCPHFHLSLQSGCDKTLKAMGRRYDTARYLQSCDILRKYFPGCAITTDLIVGFPGETEDDFSQTLAFIERFSPAQVHIFPYSRREGTRAYSYPCQLTRAEKESRAERAQKICSLCREKYLASLIGKSVCVLFEQEENGVSVGHSPEYIPVYVKKTGLHNQVITVKCTKPYKDGIFAEISE